jgi:maltooligosyltrehalose synthase
VSHRRFPSDDLPRHESRYVLTLGPNESKTCCSCGHVQLARFFHLDRTRKDGRSPRCMICQAEVKRKRREKARARLGPATVSHTYSLAIPVGP